MDFSMDSLKDILARMVDPAKGAFKPSPPELKNKGAMARMLVQVVDIKGDIAMLKYRDGTFSARIEVPAKKGDFLLLEYQEKKGEMLEYRILARADSKSTLIPKNHQTTSGQENILWSFQVAVQGPEEPYPVLVRYYPQTSRNVPDKKGKKKYLDLMVETVNLGLVMIRISKKNDVYACEFLVETKKAGELLEKEARDILGEKDNAYINGDKPIYWRVHPIKKDFENSFANGNILIDTMA